MEAEERSTPGDAPRGTHQARIDDKGRLKLPVKFQEYVGIQKLFITSVDTRIARIYPLSVWKENEKFFEESGDALIHDLQFIANQYGDEAEADAQGRILMPTVLRRELKMENQPVWLDYSKGAINVYSKEVYEEREREAKQNVAGKLAAARARGFK